MEETKSSPKQWKSKIFSLSETVKLSVSISPRNFYTSSKSVKEKLLFDECLNENPHCNNNESLNMKK